MNPSQKCIDLIKQFEGVRLESYLCPAKIWTIGVGHTGSTVGPNQKITEHQAEVILNFDLDKFAKGVSDIFKGITLTQGQFDALVSFSFNCGIQALAGSTLCRHIKAGNFMQAANQFPRWNKAGGKVLPGLTKRREAEKQLFLS
jgi:lysozyme